MKKPWIVLLLFASITGFLGFYVQSKEASEVKHVHHHAGFKVYIDDQLQDYTDFQYMSLSPCSVEKQDLTAEELQMEKAHLHDQVGDVVHVHTSGATWGDLFKNLNVVFDKDKEIVTYDSRETISDILESEIQPYQSIVIVVGDQSKTSEYQQLLVMREHIEEVEQRSELCSS